VHRRLARPVEQEIGQAADEDGCWLVGVCPTKITYRAFFGRAFDDLRHRRYGVRGRKRDDLLRS
jgi:hypothetical protein